jgi:energy-coupling factor transporter ATP-binding protein EcfA2
MIQLRDFSYRYRDNDRYALQGVSLEIEEGELVLLTGPSGSGKSTLFLALAGFLFSRFAGEHSGEVEIAGLDPSREPIYRIADVVGLVQQNPEDQFCTLMVEDEIAFGLENRRVPADEIGEKLAWSLEAVGATHLRHRPLHTLSGGEKQKVALAAILAAGPRVILFDEPTSNLDIPSTREIFKLILELRQRTNLTLLVIEHKLDFLQYAHPRLINMESGRIVPSPANMEDRLGTLRPPRFPARKEEPLLEVKGLSAGYDGTPVLSGINLILHPGEMVSLMGDNGSGKSTLLFSLLGLIPPLAGSLRCQGRNLKDLAPASLYREIGMVFQNPDHQIFSPTVWKEATLGAENFHLPLDSYQDSTRRLLERAGLGDRLQDHPFQLSFGEKRRLNLISVLCYQPRILLLDEIFVGQDQENALFLLGLVVDYAEEGNCVVLVNHKLSYYTRVATRLVFLRNGRITIDGTRVEGMASLREQGELAYLPGGAP